jgi:hypothetical protein
MTDTQPTTGKRGRPKKGSIPAVSFSDLEFAPAEMPKRSNAEPNPFLDVLTESFEYDSARAATVPEEAAPRMIGLLRRAADELNIGVSVDKTEPTKDGTVTVTFKGKERRKKRKKDEAVVETTEGSEENSEQEGEQESNQEGEQESNEEGSDSRQEHSEAVA